MSPPETTRNPRQLGNYDLLAKVAEGGMGAVYKARNRFTGQIVALKVIPADTARNPLLLKRFEQEFKAASLIDHPNVVKALDYSGAGPTPFLVMEFVDGETLGQRVERDGPMPEADAVRAVAQVCEGLHRAHKQGLIHRDVKPDNVMIAFDGVVKLTDLGLVKELDGEQNLTRTGRGLGTPHFMAPEQFRNAKAADVRCDVYSLAATMYMLVTGVIPFEKTTPLDCWMKKTRNDFPPPRQLAPHLSERVNWAICRAMSAKPEDRPASCREFMEDLTGSGWQSGQGPPPYLAAVPPAAASPADLWYVVYRDGDGQLHTVKGATDAIRRNVAAGALGDVPGILVCRTKTGQFQPLKVVAEFRDLVVGTPLGSPAAQARRSPATTPDDLEGSGAVPGSGGIRSPETPPEKPLTPLNVLLPTSSVVFTTGGDLTEHQPVLAETLQKTSIRQALTGSKTVPDTADPARPVDWVPWVMLAAAVIAVTGLTAVLLVLLR